MDWIMLLNFYLTNIFI